MARKDRGSSVDLKSTLLKHGHTFSFFQAMRLLHLICGISPESESSQDIIKEQIKVRPDLSLAFPPSDIISIEEKDNDGISDYQVTTSFFGLYGVSSPLPIFYSEDLIHEASDDESVSRDFIDILHHRLFRLLFECWYKYQLVLQVIERNNPHCFERLFCLLGLGEKTLREDLKNPFQLIRYIGLFTQLPHSALALKILLGDALGRVPVEIIPCVLRKAKIPEHQRFAIGGNIGTLGIDTIVGEEIEDRMGKFRIQIGPLDKNEYKRFLPGNDKHNNLMSLTKIFVTEPLEFEVEVILAKEKAEKVCLGSQWCELGMDTWLFSTDELGEVSIVL